MLEIMQGDQYAIPIGIKFNGVELTDADASVVEIAIGKTIRKSNDGSVRYDHEVQKWMLYLTQDETFAMCLGAASMQLRVKLKGSSDVIGVDLPPIRVTRATSKEVL